MKIGWIGVGRMGAPMAARLLKAGYDVSIWNRTRAKAETAELKGAKVVDITLRARRCRRALHHGQHRQGPEGRLLRPGGHVPRRAEEDAEDCSSIARPSAWTNRPRCARGLDKLGVKFLAAPVSGNPKCVRAGKFCCVVSGPDGRLRGGKAAPPRHRAARRRPMPARASSPACARSPSTSCSRWSTRT